MSETTNLAGGVDESIVESPRTSTRSIWGKNTPEHYSPRVKNINEVKNHIFLIFKCIFSKQIENFALIFTLISRDVCPNQFVLQI